MNKSDIREVKQFLSSIFYDEITFSYEDATEAFFEKITKADRAIVVNLIKFCDQAQNKSVDNRERQRIWADATGGDYQYEDDILIKIFDFIGMIAKKELQRRSARTSLVKRKKNPPNVRKNARR